MQYVKKPVVIEAVQWTGGNLREIIDLIGLHPSAEKWTWEEYEGVVRREGLKIFTLEGTMMAGIGDFIIKGVNGEYYPCKPDIFEKTYSPYKPRRVPGPDGSLPLTEKEMAGFKERMREEFPRYFQLTFKDNLRICGDRIAMVFEHDYTRDEMLIPLNSIKEILYFAELFNFIKEDI